MPTPRKERSPGFAILIKAWCPCDIGNQETADKVRAAYNSAIKGLEAVGSDVTATLVPDRR
jgi:hypothetical protein